jgi:hypothetical protein
MDAAPVALWVIEAGQVLWANQACAHLLGEASPQAFAGRPLAQWLGGQGQAALQAAMRPDAPRQGQPSVSLRLSRHDGVQRDVELQLSHLHWQGRRLVMVAFHDVTLRASELRQLLRSRRT